MWHWPALFGKREERRGREERRRRREGKEGLTVG
jgi:hypothetical protein